MTENNKISDYITFPRTFDNYKWYKPILVFIVALIIYIILSVLLAVIFYYAFGANFVTSIMSGGYEVLNTELGQIFSDLGIIIMFPSIYIASKIVKDRPFSSYSSSRGGWNSKLYFKALIIPFVFLVLSQGIDTVVNGAKGTNHFSVLFLILVLILVPLQCIAEEYAFRGLIMQSLGAWFKIPILVIVIQAIIFTVVHGYNSLGLIDIFISGIIFGFLAWKTNGIEVGSALHTANNLSIALFVMFGLQSTSSNIQFNDLIVSVVLQVVLFLIIYYVGMKTNWYGEIEESVEN